MPSRNEIRDGQRVAWAGLSAGWEKWDLNPRIRAFSPILCLTTQVGEKSLSWGFHAAMVTGAVRLVSSGYTGAVGVCAASGAPSGGGRLPCFGV